MNPRGDDQSSLDYPHVSPDGHQYAVREAIAAYFLLDVIDKPFKSNWLNRPW